MDIEDLRVVANPTLVREHALEKLRSAIATGLYPPGTRLVERELCEALGVSRTSVREALRQLQSESLIEVGPRRTIAVASVGSQDAHDLYALREMVEGTAIRRFVARRDPKAVKRLQAAYKAIERAANKGDLPTLSLMAGEFYEEILDSCGSRVLRDTGRQLLKRVSYLRLTSMQQPKRLEDGLSEWGAILEAVSAHDGDAAASALSQHIRNSRDAIVAGLRQREAPEFSHPT